MKVVIKVTPLVALESFDMEFSDDTTLGEINRLIEARVKREVGAAVDSWDTQGMSLAREYSIKWHESNIRWHSDNEPQEALFSVRESGK